MPMNAEKNARRRAVEKITKQFEDAWRSAPPPRIEDFLTAKDIDRRTLLVELAHIDLELRLKAGQEARVEEYLLRFSELESAVEDVIDLVEAEYKYRSSLGQQPTLEEYWQRFPQYH